MPVTVRARVHFFDGGIYQEDFQVSSGSFSTISLTNPAYRKIWRIGLGPVLEDPLGQVIRPVAFDNIVLNSDPSGLPPPPPPPPQPEPEGEICGDGLDNDRDGSIDEDCPPAPPGEVYSQVPDHIAFRNSTAWWPQTTADNFRLVSDATIGSVTWTGVYALGPLLIRALTTSLSASTPTLEGFPPKPLALVQRRQ